MRKIIMLVLVLSWADIPKASAADNNEALQFFEEEAKVITASRHEQSVLDAPVAVDVINREEIAASGATNIWDVLRFHPGVNVVDADTPHSMRAIVSIRGFVEGFARNVLVLVDGRNAVSSNAGGVFWAQLPVQLQDVERIEIIRGPNAALYGTGAGLGVINIITKRPAGKMEGALQGLLGNRDMKETSGSFDSRVGPLDYHLSYTYHADSGLLNAKANPGNPSETNLIDPAGDFFQSNKLNFRSSWRPAAGTTLDLFAGGSWNNEGIAIDKDPTARDHFSEHFEMAKLNSKLSENSILEVLSAYKEYKDSFSPTAIGGTDHSRNRQYQEEIVHHLNWRDGRNVSSYGLSYEDTQEYSDHEFFSKSPQGYRIYRGFFNQSVMLSDHLTAVGAAAWEAADRGSPHPNYQLASIFKPTPQQAYRVSYSVAHTIPTLRLLGVNELRDLGQQRIGNPGLRPETLYSYETGFRGEWMEHHLEPDLSLYYTRVVDIDDDSSATSLSPVEANTGSTGVTFANTNQAIERGAEAQLKYRFSPQRWVYANYTYEHVTDWSNNMGEVTKSVPAHALNLGAMTELSHGFQLSFNAGYKDSYIIDNQADELAVHAYWRLDARIAYAVRENVKLFVAGQNLLKPRHQEFSDGLTVPRAYYGGMSVKFAAK